MPNFFLVHITGYRQPRQEWLQVIRSGVFDYHDIKVEDGNINVSIDGTKAVVTGRGTFTASIYGMTRPWPLEFTLHLICRRGRWPFADATYSSR